MNLRPRDRKAPWSRAGRLITLGAVLFAPGAHAAVRCTVLADAATGKVLRREGVCDQRVTAASTFKIAIALMGYDAGLLKDEHTPALPFRKGYPDWIPAWRTTTDPTSWIANSVVWYSQQVTMRLGEGRFRRYVRQFHYGNEDVSGDPGKHDGLTRAWLSSSLKISPLEQVGFLEALVGRRLGVSARAYDMTTRISAVTVLANGWSVHGKTGTGSPRRADGAEVEGRDYGWFVGWATKGGRTVVFARLIQDEGAETPMAGPRAKAGMLEALPGMLDGM